MTLEGTSLTKSSELQRRTKQFALRIIRLFQALPQTEEARIIGRQFLRSGTSVGANYRAACRGRSRAEFIAKLGIVIEEADETVYWIELLVEGRIVPESRLGTLLGECNQLLAIFAASAATARANRPNPRTTR